MSRPLIDSSSSMNAITSINTKKRNKEKRNRSIRYHNFQVKLQNYSYSSTRLGNAASWSSDSNWSCHKSRKQGMAQTVTFALKFTLIALMHSWPFLPLRSCQKSYWSPTYYGKATSKKMSLSTSALKSMKRPPRTLIHWVWRRCLPPEASWRL